jgi:hypothetical protein
VRVLQVHHRQQLAARDVPVVTKGSDLAVVCANCHLLLHLNPEKALSVKELQEMLRVDSATRMPNNRLQPDRGPLAVRSESESVRLGRGR